jgi:hypothetical protein
MKSELQRLTDIANEEALAMNGGDRATCILTSHALCDVLKRVGHDAA